MRSCTEMPEAAPTTNLQQYAHYSAILKQVLQLSDLAGRPLFHPDSALGFEQSDAAAFARLLANGGEIVLPDGPRYLRINPGTSRLRIVDAGKTQTIVDGNSQAIVDHMLGRGENE